MARTPWSAGNSVTTTRVNSRHIDILPQLQCLGQVHADLLDDGATTEDVSDPHARIVVPIVRAKYWTFFFAATQVVTGPTPATAFFSARLQVWDRSQQLFQVTIPSTGRKQFQRWAWMEGLSTLGDVTGLNGVLTFHLWKTAGTWFPTVIGLTVIGSNYRDAVDFHVLGDPAGVDEI